MEVGKRASVEENKSKIIFALFSFQFYGIHWALMELQKMFIGSFQDPKKSSCSCSCCKVEMLFIY